MSEQLPLPLSPVRWLPQDTFCRQLGIDESTAWRWRKRERDPLKAKKHQGRWYIDVESYNQMISNAPDEADSAEIRARLESGKEAA